MKKAVLRAIKDFSLLGDYRNATVTVALSGGADSMALLHLLNSIKNELEISVEAAHFNHLIRGEEAERDENFVKDFCRNNGIKLYVGQGDVPAFAKEKGVSLETAARQMRYDYLSRINKDFIATAHTASDNLETVIFNLTRGTAIDGLCGIPPKRDIFIRPLIYASREQIEEYCKENDIPFVTDSTNLSDDYTRNKIRHNIVPILKEINPSVEKAIIRMSASLREDSIYIYKEADRILTTSTDQNGFLILDDILPLDIALKKRIIKKYVSDVTKQANLEAVHIDSVLYIMDKSGKTDLPGGWTAVSGGGKLKVLKSDTAQRKTEYIVEITETDNNFFEKNQNVNNLLLKNAIDCDKIVGKYTVRTRCTGDSIRLKNRGCTKNLTKLYNECNIPVDERDVIPVIADEKGVIWIYGIGVAHRCAISDKSKKILMIKTEKDKG